MPDTAPVESPSPATDPPTVTDAELDDVLYIGSMDPDEFTVTRLSDVKAVLYAGLGGLRESPLAAVLDDIRLWPTTDPGELVITVDTRAGVRLASQSIALTSFAEANDRSTTDVVRHVLNELLRHHHDLTGSLDRLSATPGSDSDLAAATAGHRPVPPAPEATPEFQALTGIGPLPAATRDAFAEPRVTGLRPRDLLPTNPIAAKLEPLRDRAGLIAAIGELDHALATPDGDDYSPDHIGALADRIVRSARHAAPISGLDPETAARAEVVTAALTGFEVVDTGDYSAATVVSDPQAFELWLIDRTYRPDVAGVIEPTATVLARLDTALNTYDHSPIYLGDDLTYNAMLEVINTARVAMVKLRHLDPDAARRVDAARDLGFEYSPALEDAVSVDAGHDGSYADADAESAVPADDLTPSTPSAQTRLEHPAALVPAACQDGLTATDTMPAPAAAEAGPAL